MSYRSVLNVSNGGPSNSLRIKHKAQNLPVGCLANTLSKSEEKKEMIFDLSTTLSFLRIISLASLFNIQKPSPQSYKTQIKILPFPGLANQALNNPAQEQRF